MIGKKGKSKEDPSLKFLPSKKSLNQYIESAADRNHRLRKEIVRKERNEPRHTMSKGRRHLLFINPGTEKLNLLRYALANGTPKPKFCDQGTFAQSFTLNGGKLYFENLPVINSEEKAKLVKETYFNPKMPSTIEPIYLMYKDKFANLSKTNVKQGLNQLEVYQLNQRRKKPPKILNKMNLNAPGIIASDMFFPGQGWAKVTCLTIMDCWSRFSRVYVLEKKTKVLTLKCFEKFFKEFLSMGHRPRVLLTDKGSEFIGLPNSALFQKWTNCGSCTCC